MTTVFETKMKVPKTKANEKQWVTVFQQNNWQRASMDVPTRAWNELIRSVNSKVPPRCSNDFNFFQTISVSALTSNSISFYSKNFSFKNVLNFFIFYFLFLVTLVCSVYLAFCGRYLRQSKDNILKNRKWKGFLMVFQFQGEVAWFVVIIFFCQTKTQPL